MNAIMGTNQFAHLAAEDAMSALALQSAQEETTHEIIMARRPKAVLMKSEGSEYQAWHDGEIVQTRQNMFDLEIWANEQGYEIEIVK